MVRWTEIIATVCLSGAIVQSFVAQSMQPWLMRKFKALPRATAFKFVVFDIEGVFIFWTLLYLLLLMIDDWQRPFHLVSQLRFTEVIVVSGLMFICSSEVISEIVILILELSVSIFQSSRAAVFLIITLTFGPLFGSFITQPAAMTILAFVLRRKFFSAPLSSDFKYAILATLLVNISIGGTLTPFAAPPILMVAHDWNWDLRYMLLHFGWKGIEASVVSSLWLAGHFRKELATLAWPEMRTGKTRIGFREWQQNTSGIFYFQKKQFFSALAIGLFLASVIILSSDQSWWLSSLFQQLSNFELYVATIAITGIVDNAAITALGLHIPALTGDQKYLLVAASVVGGGLTLMANAPNLIAYSIVKNDLDLGRVGFSAFKLFRAALVPTLISALAFAIF